LDGCVRNEISFESVPHDNYDNTSGYGASGWWLKHEPLDIKELPGEDDGESVRVDDVSSAATDEDEPSFGDEVTEDLEEGEAIFRSFFMSDGDNAAFSREADEDALCDESEEN
jgi:hypothetical protein